MGGSSRKVMIMVAPNGARRTKQDHPALPMTAEELAAEAKRCRDAGAAAIHMHVRGPDGAHVLDAGRYLEATEAVKSATGGDMVVQITTEAVGVYTAVEQISVVRDVVPAAVSVALKELVPDEGSEAGAQAFFTWMKEQRAAPQFILYGAEEVTRFFRLCDKGVIPFARPFLLFVLGRYAADQQSVPEDLDPFLDALGGRDVPWAMCAFGRRELACAEAAIAAGGHVRVGFENNLHRADGTVAATNADLVAATAGRIIALGHEVMTGDEAKRFIDTTLV